MDEFNLIHRFFTRETPSALLGIGDDAALIQPATGQALAISADMLVEGRHFLPDTDPFRLGWKTLAVNLSDLAAMGALPRWALLSLALPNADPSWLSAFSQGFFALATQYRVELIGGDTTRGPRNLSVQIIGEVPPTEALRRDGAAIGDDIWISGYLGEASLGLAVLQHRVPLETGAAQMAVSRLETPTPRVELGLALRGIAHSAIDISDGLLADLGHILARSQVGALLDVRQLVCRPALHAALMSPEGLHFQLAGGDDYELCFTAAVAQRHAINKLAKDLGLPVTRIGQIVPQGLTVLDMEGEPMTITKKGFNHFAD